MKIVGKGKIICFEGLDGAGKRTQAALLKKKLNALGIKAKIYSYPDYSSAYGKIIHGYLHGKIELGRTEHFILFLIDIMKDSESIKKELERGTFVIMDRYFYTAPAYICPSGLDYERAKRLIGLMKLASPFVVFYLDIPSSLVPKRKMKHKGSLDKFEKDQKFLKEVRGFYQRMFKERYACNTWTRVDASMPISAVSADVIDFLCKKMH